MTVKCVATTPKPRTAPPISAGRPRAVGCHRQADGGEQHRDEEGAAGQRRVVGDGKVRVKGEQRDIVGGPDDGAGRESGQEQPAASPGMLLARLGKQEKGDEASEGADRCREENELWIVALQYFSAGDKHLSAPMIGEKAENFAD